MRFLIVISVIVITQVVFLFEVVLVFAEGGADIEKSQTVLLEDKIVAVVNGEPITKSKLKERLDRIFSKDNESYTADSDEQRTKLETMQKNILEQLIEETLLLQEAAKENITVSDEDLEPIKTQIMISKLLSAQIDAKIVVSEEEIIIYFNNNKHLFVDPERVKLDEVFLLVKPGSTVETWESAKERMNTLYQKIKDSSDFLMAAKGLDNEVTLGSSNFLIRGELPPEVEQEAFSMPVGSLSTVIKSPIGFHIIRVTDRRNQTQKELEEVKNIIKGIIFKQKAREKYETWIAGLKDSSYIAIKQDKDASVK